MKNKKAMPAGRQGFTLFELLVSISIIAILTAIATVSFSGAQKKARDVRRAEDLNNIQKAAEQYYSQHSYNYPTGTGDLVAAGGTLQAWPVDPKSGSPYSPTMTTGGYCVCAALDSGAGGNSNGTDCSSSSFIANGPNYCVKNQQ